MVAEKIARGKSAERVRQLLADLKRSERQRKEVEKALLLGMQEVKRSRRRVLRAQEEVRRQVAETLHGPVQSQLLVATTYLKQAQDRVEKHKEDAIDLLVRARELIERINREDLSSLITRLHPPVEHMGLVGAIRSLVDRARLPFQVKLKVAEGVTVLDQVGGEGFDPGLRLAAYRVVEEALGNVGKHAGARSAEVALGLASSGELTVDVWDDGRGFDVEMEPGPGILFMTDYCGAVGGTLHIASRVGEGTTVSASFPLS